MKNKVVILLGSNIGDKKKQLKSAICKLKKSGKILKKSAIYESEPWGFDAEESFLNQVVILQTYLPSEILLLKILDFETELGRVRKLSPTYLSRTIDIDILFFNNEIINTERLIIPHPRLHKRMFTLLPLQEVCKNYIHPVLQKTIDELVAVCPDKLSVKKLIE